MSTQECIDNVPLGWKRFCLQHLHDKGQWKVEYVSKGRWKLSEPDSGGWWTIHKMNCVHDWNSPGFIQKIGWEIARKDVLSPLMEKLKSELQEAGSQ